MSKPIFTKTFLSKLGGINRTVDCIQIRKTDAKFKHESNGYRRWLLASLGSVCVASVPLILTKRQHQHFEELLPINHTSKSNNQSSNWWYLNDNNTNNNHNNKNTNNNKNDHNNVLNPKISNKFQVMSPSVIQLCDEITDSCKLDKYYNSSNTNDNNSNNNIIIDIINCNENDSIILKDDWLPSDCNCSVFFGENTTDPNNKSSNNNDTKPENTTIDNNNNGSINPMSAIRLCINSSELSSNNLNKPKINGKIELNITNNNDDIINTKWICTFGQYFDQIFYSSKSQNINNSNATLTEKNTNTNTNMQSKCIAYQKSDNHIVFVWLP